VGDGGGTAVACNSQNTKLLELRFRALLNESGTRQIKLARA
jgi:phage-related tail fiber protein